MDLFEPINTKNSTYLEELLNGEYKELKRHLYKCNLQDHPYAYIKPPFFSIGEQDPNLREMLFEIRFELTVQKIAIRKNDFYSLFTLVQDKFTLPFYCCISVCGVFF